MIKELANFISSLGPDFRALGIKPKEGLHILLRLQNEEEHLLISEHSLAETAFTREKEPTPQSIQFLKRCSTLAQLSWMVDTNKCIDTITRAIHSCSPFCLAIKRDNLKGGENYEKRKREGKTLVYNSLKPYFKGAEKLIDSDSEIKESAKSFARTLDSEEIIHSLLGNISSYSLLKDSDYVIFYLDVPVELYEQTNARYLTDKLFNTNYHNKTVDGKIFGTSDFFNGYPTKKPFLLHQSASFDIANRISAEEAKNLFDFKDIINRGILPKPLPIFIHQDEIVQKSGRSLKDSSIIIFKREAEKENNRIGYWEIIEELYEQHEDELGNYYLLFFDRSGIKDFDFVPKFEYKLKDGNGDTWVIEDLFGGNNGQHIKNVFHFQQAVLWLIFSNGLIVKTKSGDFQYRYFDEIDSKYIKSGAFFLLIMQYRKAFYDFVYKARRQAVTETMFNTILQTVVLEDIRLDEIKNGYHTEDRNIRQKLNIWFSLKEKFNISPFKNKETMSNKLKEHREFIQKLAKGEADIDTDEQYAFAAGQVIYYLMSKSKSSDRSYKRLEPFLQQAQSQQLNMAISRMFDAYKHQNFSANFRNPFAQVVAYDTKRNIRDLIPTLLSGVFSPNNLFSDKEDKADLATVQSDEETNN